MTRKNIFEILSNNEIDVIKEIKKIAFLLEKENIVFYYNCFDVLEMKLTILQYIQKTHMFINWKYRKTYLSIEEMMEDLGINDIYNSKKISNEKTICYLEFAVNMLLLLKQKHIKGEGYIIEKNIFSALTKNIDDVIDFLNLNINKKNEDIAILTEKNSSVTAVSEIIDDKNLSFQILEYNHYLLKGNLEKKKSILLSLADKLEPQRKALCNINNKLENNLFYLFNNCCIRHNNKEKGNHFIKYMSKISDSELEKIYDETYQMVLLAFLLLDNIERQKYIESLKDNINKSK